MFRFLLLAGLVTCSLGAENLEKRPRHDGKIFGGRPVYIYDFPYQAAVLYGNTHRCSGAIISADWAVTAAQCIDGLTPANVRFASGSTYQGGYTNLHNVTQLIPHPNYDYYMLDSDIGLAQVAEPFFTGKRVHPIKIKYTQTSDSGAPAVVTGWVTRQRPSSYENQLQAFPVEVIYPYECEYDYGYYEGLTDNMICAVGDAGGKDACLGDVGSPLVVGNFLVGLLSWGFRCGESGYTAVYINVAHFKSFVTDHTGVEYNNDM